VSDDGPAALRTGRWVAHHLLGVHLDRGRIRFGRLSRFERWVAVFGMTALAGLLVLLIRPQFVPGHLLTLYGPGGLGAEEIPRAVPALFLVGLGLFSIILLYGSMRCPTAVCLFGAVVFVLVNSVIADFFTHGPFGFARFLVGTAFVVTPVALVAAKLVHHRLVRDRVGNPERVGSVLSAVSIGAAAAFYMTTTALYLHALRSHAADLQVIGQGIQYTINNLYDFLTALFILSALAVVRFSYGISQIVAETSGSALRTSVAKLALVALLVTEAVFTVRRFNGSGWAAFRSAPFIAVLVVVGALLVAGFAWFSRSAFRHPESYEVGVERLTFIAAAVYALPLVVYSIGTSATYLEAFVSPGPRIGVYSGPDLFGWISRISSQDWFQLVPEATIFGLLLLFGLWAVAHRRDRPSREWFAGLVMISMWAAWALLVTWLAAFGAFQLFTDEVALVVTVAIAAFLVRNRRTIDKRQIALLTAAAAMTWLISTDGNFLSILGRDLGLGPDVVVAFGTALVLIGNSEFTGGDNRWFPRPARPLVWVGYLGIAVLVTFWLKFTVGVSTVGGEYQLDTTSGYLFFAMPLAVWLVMRGRFRPDLPRQGSPELTKA